MPKPKITELTNPNSHESPSSPSVLCFTVDVFTGFSSLMLEPLSSSREKMLLFFFRSVSNIVSSRNPSLASFCKVLYHVIFVSPEAFTIHLFIRYFFEHLLRTRQCVLSVEHTVVNKWSLISRLTF